MPVCHCKCARPLPDAAVHDGDVFATRACAAAHYGTETVSPASSPVGETRGGHHARVVFDGAAVPFNELTCDRARADVVARRRVAAEKRS